LELHLSLVHQVDPIDCISNMLVTLKVYIRNMAVAKIKESLKMVPYCA
jgi:hypothetical protein